MSHVPSDLNIRASVETRPPQLLNSLLDYFSPNLP